MATINRRVAFFLPTLHGGGGERVMVNLARGLAEKDLKIDLVLAKAEGSFLFQVPSRVRVIDLGVKRVLAGLPGLVSYLRRERPRALLSAIEHANVVALWAKRLARVPTRVVVSAHNTLSQIEANAPDLKTRLASLSVRLFYPWADAVVAVSQGVATDLLRLTKLPREKVQVIYNPVVTPELFIKAEEPLDHPWFAPGEPPVVLSVGRLTRQKDYPTLIQAFDLVRKERAARLVILGEGEERPRLEALIGELGLERDVTLPGFVANPYKYIKRAVVFVLSSKWEGLPTVLIEALALGTPVIAADCPHGPAEILEGGKWGKLVPAGEINALAKSIMEVLDGHYMPCARRRAEDFRLEVIQNLYLEILGI